MKVHLHIQQGPSEVEVHIYAPEYNESIEQLMNKINSTESNHLIGYRDVDLHLLKPHDIFSIFTEDGKVFIQTDEEEFESKSKLYEIEASFHTNFIRINKSMLVNIDKISSIQSKMLSNPQLVLSNGVVVTVSRKYFKLLKEKLGLGREKE